MFGPATLDRADRAEARRLYCAARLSAIMGAPEAKAEERHLLAFALAIRLDLSPDDAVLLLRQAPELRTGDAVDAWVSAIPRQPDTETRH